MKFLKFLPITLMFGSSWVCHNFDNKYRNTSKTIVKSNIFGGIENAESIFFKIIFQFFGFSRLQINDEMIRYLSHGFWYVIFLLFWLFLFVLQLPNWFSVSNLKTCRVLKKYICFPLKLIVVLCFCHFYWLFSNFIAYQTFIYQILLPFWT